MSQPESSAHEQALATAFDAQAALFEQAPMKSDPTALARLIETADLPPRASVIDVGCGPGLVAEALLEAGHRVLGIDLSAKMIARARRRTARFGDRARFEVASIHDDRIEGRFDAALSRSVLHHVEDPLLFLARQAELLRPGGVLVLCDHTTDPNPECRGWHQSIERLRDRSHVANATPGELVDLLDAAGLTSIRLIEEPFFLDLDEWFDRGVATAAKDEVRARLLDGGSARGFEPSQTADGCIRIHCWTAIARGIKTTS